MPMGAGIPTTPCPSPCPPPCPSPSTPPAPRPPPPLPLALHYPLPHKKKKGPTLSPAHIRRSLRALAGISDHELALRFPLTGEELGLSSSASSRRPRLPEKTEGRPACSRAASENAPGPTLQPKRRGGRGTNPLSTPPKPARRSRYSDVSSESRGTTLARARGTFTKAWGGTPTSPAASRPTRPHTAPLSCALASLDEAVWIDQGRQASVRASACVRTGSLPATSESP